MERRVRGERRRGLDRRIVERRVEVRSVAGERRVLLRRRVRERRNPLPRRMGIDRRGSGLDLADFPPLTVI